MFSIPLVWGVSLFVPVVAGQGASAKVAFVSLPEVVAAGEAFQVTVQYELPPGQQARLNVELKNSANEVIAAATADVAGTGKHTANFTAPAQIGKVQVAGWIGTDWRHALSPILHTEPINVLPADLAAKRRARLGMQQASAKTFHRDIGPRPAGKYTIALLKDDLPDHDRTLADRLVVLLDDDGYELSLIDANLMTNAEAIGADRFDLLILPSAHALPAESVPVVRKFLSKGGDLLTLNAPAFADPLFKAGDRWLSRKQWQEFLLDQPTENVLFDFDKDDLSGWSRNTNAPDHPFKRELVAGENGPALRIHIGNMAGWDGLLSPELNEPFPSGHVLTCFYAKGSGQTRSAMLEWREKDGSRWIAVFPVTNRWRRVVLTPNDFKFWQSVPNRGQPSDRFNPPNACQLNFGVAWSHTGPRGGEHEFFIDEFGTAPSPFGDVPSVRLASPPPIEGLCPTYKFYPLTDVATLQRRGPSVDGQPTLPLPTRLRAHHPRPTGSGFNKHRKWRWIPLLEAVGSENQWRGAPAILYVDFEGSTKGSARTAISVSDPQWYRQPQVLSFVADCVRRTARGIFIQEAGSEFYAYRPGQPVLLGARIANLSRADAKGLELRYELTPAGKTLPAMTITRPLDLPAGHTETMTHSIKLPQGNDEYHLVVRLRQNDRVIDQVTHEVAVFRPKPPEKRKYLTVRDGDFWLDGKKWYAHGVNYMPSTGVGIEDHAYFEYWMGSRSYDPEFIQRDLERCRDMGLNTVSIFIYHRSVPANNLIDILRRCEKLGLLVNLSIRPGTPMGYQWPWWEEIIRHARLWEIDAVYAYDIAWEPFFGTPPQRRNYDPQWREWVSKKYGSIQHTEKAWSFAGPRYKGKLSTPLAEHLGKDGPHRKLVADYRQFVDELVHANYQAAADEIRTLDANHLISFRMTVTGDPTFDGSRNMPYDFKAVARSMAFLAPEGYGRIGDWQRIRPGMFTVSYARFCADKPVLWAEAGVSIWNRQTMQMDSGQLAFQGRYFADFYKMVLQSYSNGIVWWWYPGGFRTNENSDYGIINPDGTDRPVTRTIRRFAAKMLAEKTLPKPDFFIEIDRNADARGLFGIYDRVKSEYWQAIDAGKTVALKAKSN